MPPSIAARTWPSRSWMLESTAPLIATLTLPGSQRTCASTLASHVALQSTSALGARTSPVQYGSSNATLQLPRHSPSHLALAVATHLPSHAPSHLPLQPPSHEPSQLPEHSPCTSTAQVPLHSALHLPRISPPSHLMSSLPGSAWMSQLPMHCAYASSLALQT